MMTIDLAFRNVLRNRRRSIMTLLALAVGTMAMLVFAGYVTDTIRGLQTSTVRSTGHLQVVKKGYIDFGRADPARFSIMDYEGVVDVIESDEMLSELLFNVTPILAVEGIASNNASSYSTGFSGEGVEPEGRTRQLSWDGFRMRIPPVSVSLSNQAPEAGTIGLGVAQLLGLCKAAEGTGCSDIASLESDVETDNSESAYLDEGIAALSENLTASANGATPSYNVDLLTSTANGTPNVIRMEVASVQKQAIRQVDSTFVAMPLELAQRLSFGMSERGVSSIVIQLHDTAQMPAAKARIAALIHQSELPLEVLTFNQISSVYDQIVSNYSMIFQFIAILIVIITLFSVANAVNMAVNERTSEIGTLRALGFREGMIRNIFLSEGVMIAAFGAALGVLFAILFQVGVNVAGFSWTPPGRSTPIPIRVDIFGYGALIPFAMIGMAFVAAFSSALPARRAAKMNITEALRHA